MGEGGEEGTQHEKGRGGNPTWMGEIKGILDKEGRGGSNREKQFYFIF